LIIVLYTNTLTYAFSASEVTTLRRYTNLFIIIIIIQCFDAVGWAAGRASGNIKTEWWGAGMVICLE